MTRTYDIDTRPQEAIERAFGWLIKIETGTQADAAPGGRMYRWAEEVRDELSDALRYLNESEEA